MAVHEQRLKKLRDHLRDAHDELHALPDEETTGNKSGVARLDDVIRYAGLVLEGAEAPLVSARAFAAVQSATCTISNSPRVALREADACADALLDAVAVLPGRGGRDADPEVQRAAAELQELAKQCQAHDEQMARLRKELAESRHEHAAALQAELDEFRGKLAQAQKQACDDVEHSLAEIRRMEMESAALVGSIGLAGAAELYHEQGRRQGRAAGILRGLSVLTALAAVAVAMVTTAGTEPTAESLIANLFASLLLAGLAAYLALQSERHRTRERHASALHLDLVAFSPFIEALPPEQRTEERVIMTRKLFAKSVPGTASREGPAAPHATLQRVRQATQNGHVAA